MNTGLFIPIAVITMLVILAVALHVNNNNINEENEDMLDICIDVMKDFEYSSYAIEPCIKFLKENPEKDAFDFKEKRLNELKENKIRWACVDVIKTFKLDIKQWDCEAYMRDNPGSTGQDLIDSLEKEKQNLLNTPLDN